MLLRIKEQAYGSSIWLRGKGQKMDVTKELDCFRAKVEGCDLAAFADLNTRIILCVSSASRHAQEELDTLTQTAAIVLGGAVAEGAEALLDDQKALSAITMTQVDARVYLRATASDNEALICVCAPDADLAKVMAVGTATLGHIMATA